MSDQYKTNTKIAKLIAAALQGIPTEETNAATEDESGLRERSEAQESSGRSTNDEWGILGPDKGS